MPCDCQPVNNSAKYVEQLAISMGNQVCILAPVYFSLPIDCCLYPLTPHIVDARLQATSELLTELQEAQTTRLSLAPQQSSSGHLLLPAPSQDELDTAAQVRGQLASLTAQVTLTLFVPPGHRPCMHEHHLLSHFCGYKEHCFSDSS